MPLLEVKNLSCHFRTRQGTARAVREVSFSVETGESVGLVGESGSGKSVTFFGLLGLLPSPPAVVQAEASLLGDTELVGASPRVLRKIRGSRVSLIFQEPMSAFTPTMRLGNQLTEILTAHGRCSRKEAWQKAVNLLEELGLQGASEKMRAWPHEFSGGMLQRVMIAMALLPEPELLVADEPTTALDVTIQDKILRLLKARQNVLSNRPMSLVLITHDLAVAAGVCDTILVMYGGRLLEKAPVEELFRHPRHPYTQALLRAIPNPARKADALAGIPGAPPSPYEEMPGCPFASRCPYVVDLCRATPPELKPVGLRHESACLLAGKGAL